MFNNMTAWFSSSVDDNTKRSWRNNGGSEADFDTAQFIFSSDNSCPDTERVFNSLAYKSDHLAVFHSRFILDRIEANNGSDVVLGKYFLPPREIAVMVKKQMKFCWDIPSVDTQATTSQSNLPEVHSSRQPQVSKAPPTRQPQTSKAFPTRQPQSSEAPPTRQSQSSEAPPTRQSQAKASTARQPQQGESPSIRQQNPPQVLPATRQLQSAETFPTKQSQVEAPPTRQQHAAPHQQTVVVNVPHNPVPAASSSRLPDLRSSQRHKPNSSRATSAQPQRSKSMESSSKRSDMHSAKTKQDQVSQATTVFHISQLRKVRTNELTDFVPGEHGAVLLEKDESFPN